MVILGGIIGSALSTNKAFATLPLSMMVITIAATTIPATMLMKKVGRRKGFALSSVSAAVALVLATLALKETSFLLFNIAAMIFGINMAFTQQYRYAAAESVESRYVPRAISLVLQYAGTMILLSMMFIIQAILFFAMAPAKDYVDPGEPQSERSVGEIIRQPVFIAAVMGATAGVGLMTLIMTATPISMHVNNGYSLEQTADVIQVHMLGMYVPSLFAGFLIEKFGVLRIMFIGALGLVATSIIGLQGHAVMHYWWALLLLGIGWNFLFVGGTTMLTYTYSMAERFRAQAVNEFLVFGASASASLLAGTVMYFFGWEKLMLIPIPLLMILCIVLIKVRSNPILSQQGHGNDR